MSSTRRGLPLTSSSIEKIFPKLTPAQVSRITARGHIRSMEGGEVLYEQGYRAAPFFVVVSGELEVVRPSVPVETLITSLLANATNPDYQSCSTNSDCLSRDQLARVFTALGKIIPDLHWTIKDIWTSGNRIVVRGEATGTPTGELYCGAHREELQDDVD